jgi:hypothetical protein
LRRYHTPGQSLDKRQGRRKINGRIKTQKWIHPEVVCHTGQQSLSEIFLHFINGYIKEFIKKIIGGLEDGENRCSVRIWNAGKGFAFRSCKL